MLKRGFHVRIVIISTRMAKTYWMKARFKKGIRRSNALPVIPRRLGSIFRGPFIINVCPVTRRTSGREKRRGLVFVGNAIYGIELPPATSWWILY
jgi:hypothetical protein